MKSLLRALTLRKNLPEKFKAEFYLTYEFGGSHKKQTYYIAVVHIAVRGDTMATSYCVTSAGVCNFTFPYALPSRSVPMILFGIIRVFANVLCNPVD